MNLQVEQGDYIAIMGPSGSGKTTLMNLVGCLDLPTSGQYILKDQDMSTLNDNQLAEIRNQHIGFVFQNFYLLPKMTALDNVALPLLYAGVSQKERRERAKAALESVGLAERLHFIPISFPAASARGGHRRGDGGGPELLLADEPTGALDTAAGYQIMEIFRSLADQGMTILMITHEPSIAACADKTYHILDGQLLDQAPEIPAAPPHPQAEKVRFAGGTGPPAAGYVKGGR